MAKILIVEDEQDLAHLVANWMRRDQYLVEIVSDGKQALELLKINKYDVIILDLMLPGIHGLEVCRLYRQSSGSTPILILTAKSSVLDKETGLDNGADDYLTKPFHLKELAARVRALLRRGTSSGDCYRIGEIEIDTARRRVIKGTAEIRLLPQEYRLLEFLARHPQQVFSPEQLLENVWESDTQALVDTVRGHIQRLRKKLDSPGKASIISTIYGLGYKLESEQLQSGNA